jgi:HEPN domain-containing protein
MKETTKSWVLYSSEDYKTKNVILDIEDLEKVFAFHCHQAIEKLLKAILNENKVLPPKIHDLNRLFNLLPEKLRERLNYLLEHIEELNSIYIDSRYPADFALLPNATLSKEDKIRINNATDELYNALLGILQ